MGDSMFASMEATCGRVRSLAEKALAIYSRVGVEEENTVFLREQVFKPLLYIVEEIARNRGKSYVAIVSRNPPAENYIPLPIYSEKGKLHFKPLAFSDGLTTSDIGFYPLSLVHDVIKLVVDEPSSIVVKVFGSEPDMYSVGEEPFFLGVWDAMREAVKKPLDDTVKWRTLHNLGLLRKPPVGRYDTAGYMITGSLRGGIEVRNYLIYISGKLVLYRYGKYREMHGMTEERWREYIESMRKALPEDHVGKQYYFILKSYTIDGLFMEILRDYDGELFLLHKPSEDDYVYDFSEVNVCLEAGAWWITPRRISARELYHQIQDFYPYSTLEYIVRGDVKIESAGIDLHGLMRGLCIVPSSNGVVK